MILHHEFSVTERAPVLLMGSSLGTTLEMWDGQVPLARRLRLIRSDHRGHGTSPVQHQRLIADDQGASTRSSLPRRTLPPESDPT